MDSNDLIINTKRSDVVEIISSINYPTDSKQDLCYTSREENLPLINRKEPNTLAANNLPIIDQSSEKSGFSPSQNNKTQYGHFPEMSEISSKLSKKSTGAKENKSHKRVHFNTEVETYTFKSKLSIIENYNYREEFTVENDVSETFNERGFQNPGISDVLRKNEDNTTVNSRYCPIGKEWDLLDEDFHKLRRQHLPVTRYSKLKDEDSPGDSEKSKGLSGLKKSKSCILRKNDSGCEPESENVSSWNLTRRLSMSMHNLKVETKSWFDKLVTKFTKKKPEHPLTHMAHINAENLPVFALKKANSRPKFKETDTLYQRKKWEIKTPNHVYGNLFMQRWTTVENTNVKRCYSLPDLSKIDAEDIIVHQEKEMKGWRRFPGKGRLFHKKKGRDKSGDNVSLRAWKSTKSLHFEPKSLMDKFVSKLKRI